MQNTTKPCLIQQVRGNQSGVKTDGESDEKATVKTTEKKDRAADEQEQLVVVATAAS